ncbi:MAG: hypothetical protein OEZ10_09885 [Gammaproteobacteria bacterium]|nr:hypothetical protein [Gammaproteobacteria bacterium]
MTMGLRVISLMALLFIGGMTASCSEKDDVEYNGAKYNVGVLWDFYSNDLMIHIIQRETYECYNYQIRHNIRSNGSFYEIDLGGSYFSGGACWFMMGPAHITVPLGPLPDGDYVFQFTNNGYGNPYYMDTYQVNIQGDTITTTPAFGEFTYAMYPVFARP